MHALITFPAHTSIPTAQDWDDWSYDPPKDQVEEWDRSYARKNFFGKSLKEAEDMIARNTIMAYIDDYYYMPKKVFDYYFFAFRSYVVSLIENKKQDSDAISIFFGCIQYRLENNPLSVKDIIPYILPTLQYLAKNQSSLCVSKEIYGCLQNRYQEIVSLADKKLNVKWKRQE